MNYRFIQIIKNKVSLILLDKFIDLPINYHNEISDIIINIVVNNYIINDSSFFENVNEEELTNFCEVVLNIIFERVKIVNTINNIIRKSKIKSIYE